MKISVADFSSPIGSSVFKFCVHLQVGYCVNENRDAQAHFAFFFIFSIFPSVTPNIYNTYRHFSSEFSQQLLDLGL